MGADFLTIRLVIDKNKKPNFNKGEKYIAKLRKTPYAAWPKEYRERFDEVDDSAIEAEVLKSDLDEVRRRWCGLGRDFTIFFVDRKKVFLTGGFSWGDEPCELWSSMDRLMAAGVTKACGFDY